MPCTENSSRRLVFKRLANGTSGRSGLFGAVSGQFPAKNFNTQQQQSCMGGGSAAAESSIQRRHYARRISSPLDPLVPKKGLGCRAECFQSLAVMLRPSQSCSITSFWGECKSLNGSPKLRIHVATWTLGAQGFRSAEPHKSRLQRVSPVSLREKSKSHVRATRHLCMFFRKRTRGSCRMTSQCTADERPRLKRSRSIQQLDLQRLRRPA